MTQLIQISPQKAWDLMQQEDCALLDIRDMPRYRQSHAKDAFHLTNQSYGIFQDEYDYDQPIIVMCYHGVSSQNVGAFLIEQGYEQVYSVEGGFEAWERANLPIEREFP